MSKQNHKKQKRTSVKTYVKIWGSWRLADRTILYSGGDPKVWFSLHDNHGNLQTGWVKAKFFKAEES